jgi:hypothetical protein
MPKMYDSSTLNLNRVLNAVHSMLYHRSKQSSICCTVLLSALKLSGFKNRRLNIVIYLNSYYISFVLIPSKSLNSVSKH